MQQATAEFERIVWEKTSIKKGYTTCTDGIGYASSEQTGQMSGNLPHLLVAISSQRIEALAHDDRWGFEQKMDGHRLMVDRKAGQVVTSNKLGVVNTVSNTIVENVLAMQVDDILLDGECLDHKMYVFDLLRLNGECLRSRPAIERHAILGRLDLGPNLVVVELLTTSDAKAGFLAAAEKKTDSEIVEGIVAKLLSAPYVAGRAAPSEATQCKYKFVDDVSCVVMQIEPVKRSVHIGFYSVGGIVTSTGKVGIPAKYPIPHLGTVIDVQYRHMFGTGGLCEPVFLKVRDDVRPSECVHEQVNRRKMSSILNDDDPVE